MDAAFLEREFLHRILSEKRWRNLSKATFYARFEDEVGDLDELKEAKVFSVDLASDGPSFGPSEIFVLSTGLAVLRTSQGWSLYESRERVRSRKHNADWADFARGHWSEEPPKHPGQYFVKDRDLGRRSVREIKRVEGRLVDVSGGLVRPGRVSEYLGYWWLPMIPELPESCS